MPVPPQVAVIVDPIDDALAAGEYVAEVPSVTHKLPLSSVGPLRGISLPPAIMPVPPQVAVIVDPIDDTVVARENYAESPSVANLTSVRNQISHSGWRLIIAHVFTFFWPRRAAPVAAGFRVYRS
ncbi:MAG: hypothetical protein ACXV2E_00205 [Halobacteriota archaeon]